MQWQTRDLQVSELGYETSKNIVSIIFTVVLVLKELQGFISVNKGYRIVTKSKY